MSQEIVPYADIEKMGKAVAGSGLFGVKTQEQAIALMLIAQAYGKHPAAAAMEYHIIEGKPSKKAEAMMASFIQAGGTVKWITLTDQKAEATFSHPQGGTITLDWTIERAKQAGLVDKPYSNYKKYPRSMLRSRVISEGVKTIYPAATSGMLTPEEVIEVEEAQPDANKSRVENIIDAQVTEVTPNAAKEEAKESHKAKSKSNKNDSKAESAEQKLPDGHKVIQGIITEPATYAEIGAEKKPKWVFKMGDLKLGTFDKAVFEGISAICDLQKDTPILLNIEYKERQSGEKTLRDIIKFSQAVAGQQIPI